MKLDAFRLMGSGGKWSFQLKMLDRDGQPVTRNLRITNIVAENLLFTYNGESFPLDKLDDNLEVWITGLLQLEKNDAGLPSLIRFQVEDAETGEVLSSDDFGLFLYETLPASAPNLFLGVLEPGFGNENPGGSADPIDPNNPNDPNNPLGPNDPTDPTDPNNPTDPGDPNNPEDPGTPGPGDPQPGEIPEPSTVLLMGAPLLAIALKKLKR